jgi:hypothetical protein
MLRGTNSDPAHFVDILAALAVLDYFQDPSTKGNQFAGSRVDAHRELGAGNVVDWPDLPFRSLRIDAVKWRALRMVLAGAMHTGFFKNLFELDELDQRPSCVRWYYRQFARKGDHFSRQVNRDGNFLHFLQRPSPEVVERDHVAEECAVEPHGVQQRRKSDRRASRSAGTFTVDRPREIRQCHDDFVKCMDDVPGGLATRSCLLPVIIGARGRTLSRACLQDVRTSLARSRRPT